MEVIEGKKELKKVQRKKIIVSQYEKGETGEI